MSVQIPKQHIEKEITRYRSALSQQRFREREQPRKIITISRMIGSGGRKIAEILGRKLHCAVWNKEVLDVLADQAGAKYQARMFEALDEKTQGAIDALVADFFGSAEKHTYFYLLPKAIYAIAQNDAVILGRGSYLLLPDSFRVSIKASFETRVRNMVVYDGWDEGEARRHVKQTDKQRDAFVKELSKKLRVKNCDDVFDLVINTDRLDVREAAAIIHYGFTVYYAELKKARKLSR
jgi:cytidylate kinase